MPCSERAPDHGMVLFVSFVSSSYTSTAEVGVVKERSSGPSYNLSIYYRGGMA